MKKLKCNFTREMIDDLKKYYGFLEKDKNKISIMLHYEYTANDNREIELIKELTEIDYEDGNHLVYSISKKQLRKYKLGAVDGIREYARMKKIIFHSKVIQDIQKILEMKLSKELSKEIDKEILKDMMKLKNKK